MALTKVTKSGITDNAVDADKIEDGTVLAADLANGAVTADKLASTLDISSKTVTLPNTSVTNAMLAGSIANDKLANSAITVNGASISLGGSVSAGKVSWQTVKTADFNAVAGEGYFVDTNSVGAVTATLPGSPSAGDTIAIKDYAGTFGTNALTIARNGNNIQGVANDSLISTNRASIVLVYIDATKGWLFTNESNVADLQDIRYVAATGGTITTSGDFKIHTFTGDGCFVVSCGGNAAGSGSVDYLVVAGGGGAHGDAGGGGGGGGFRVSNEYALPGPTMSPLANPTGINVSSTTYPITVGGGGPFPSPGSPSVFSTITSAGGGATGGSGGSGGGSRANSCSQGTGNTPPTSPPQGNNGGTNPFPVYSGAGGGGGAGGAGDPVGPQSQGGDGGIGSYVSPSLAVGCAGTTGPVGSTRYFSGGGGGSHDGTPGTAGSGSSGGGGAGNPSGSGTNGTANTGGGAGGGRTAGGSTGGSGIVILRYKFQN